jgi:hypothetical protein
VLIVALGGVFVAMNVLVTVAPVAILESPSPSASSGPSLAGTPSLLATSTEIAVGSPAPTASLPDAKPTIIHSAVSAKDPAGIWTVYLEYPTFQLGTTPWAARINSDMAAEAQTRAIQWELGPASNRQVPGKINSLSGTFHTELLTSALASFTLTWVDDASASTPANLVETVDYDLGTGLRIGFDSLFSDPDLALSTISIQALGQLRSILGANYDDAVTTEGTSPSRTNFLNWAITASGLKITFAEHQVTNAAGLYSVVVPWVALRPAMVTTGPVAELAGTAPVPSAVPSP